MSSVEAQTPCGVVQAGLGGVNRERLRSSAGLFTGPHSLRPQSSMNRMASQALEKMETRKFKAKGKVQRDSGCGASDSLSSSSTSDCAICLEKYMDGEVRKESVASFYLFLSGFFHKPLVISITGSSTCLGVSQHLTDKRNPKGAGFGWGFLSSSFFFLTESL